MDSWTVDEGPTMEPKTGDEVQLVVKSFGRKCAININGAPMPGVRGFTLECDASRTSKLTIDAFYLQDLVVEHGGIHAKTHTFFGYFIERADWEAFAAWRREWQDGE